MLIISNDVPYYKEKTEKLNEFIRENGKSMYADNLRMKKAIGNSLKLLASCGLTLKELTDRLINAAKHAKIARDSMKDTVTVCKTLHFPHQVGKQWYCMYCNKKTNPLK